MSIFLKVHTDLALRKFEYPGKPKHGGSSNRGLRNLVKVRMRRGRMWEAKAEETGSVEDVEDDVIVGGAVER